MSVALCRQFRRPDGTMSEKMVSLTQYREVEAGWIRVVLACLHGATDAQVVEIAARLTDSGDQMLYREALVERNRATQP